MRLVDLGPRICVIRPVQQRQVDPRGSDRSGARGHEVVHLDQLYHTTQFRLGAPRPRDEFVALHEQAINGRAAG